MAQTRYSSHFGGGRRHGGAKTMPRAAKPASLALDTALVDFFFSQEVEQTSARWYKQKLTAFVTFLASKSIRTVQQLQPEHVTAFLRELKGSTSTRFGRPLSSQTVHGYARAVRAFLKYGVTKGWYTTDATKQWKMPKRDQKLIKTFDTRQVEPMLLAADRQASRELAERDKAILLVLLDTGIRASELCGLTMDQVHVAVEDGYLIVMGKGRKERVTGTLGKRCRAQLNKCLRHFRHPREDVEAVFIARDGRALTKMGLDHMLKRLREAADVRGVRVSAHTFRHTYAVNYMSKPGASIYKLKELLGHTSAP